jgi:hypothetical protein
MSPVVSQMLQAGLEPFYPALLCVIGTSLLALLVSIGLWWRFRAIAAAPPTPPREQTDEHARESSAERDA